MIGGLGRLVEHDPRSRYYAFPLAKIKPRSVMWAHNAKVLDQGILGACTGYALAQLLNTERYWRNRVQGNKYRGYTRSRRFLDWKDAVEFYSSATQLDEFPGQYPPTDTGSSGLGVSKAGQQFHYFSGYQHTFTFEQFLAALAYGPVLAGTNWYESMFYPKGNGYITIGGELVGGHEYVVLGWNSVTEYVTCLNSWSNTWGIDGRFKMSGVDFKRLMYEQGDITVPGIIL